MKGRDSPRSGREEHDDVRIFTTKDRAAGYRVVIGIRLAFPVVTLGWVEIEWLKAGL